MRSDLNQSAEGAVTFLKAEVAPHDSMSELGKVPTKRLCFLSLYVFLSELCLINISGAIKRVKPNRKKLRNLLRPEIYPVESHIYLQLYSHGLVLFCVSGNWGSPGIFSSVSC